ncbi:MAG TPA: hypothetical protein DDW42_02745, partial [Desulfobacteraceae bacterium]|nr:hypothetical protein [Desulfobacteraceae bacterium]
RLAKGDYRNILAHHQVEIGKAYLQEGDLAKARSFFNDAISTHKKCIDAYLHLGDLYLSKQEYKKAISTWKKIVEVAPQFIFLAYRRLEGAYLKMKDLKPIGQFLKECTQSNSDAFTHLALARYIYNEGDIEGALRETSSALKIDPCFWEARRFKGEILLINGEQKDILVDYREILEHLNMPYLRFQCSECGFQPSELQWRCPQCRKWDTIRLMDSFVPESNPAPESEEILSGLHGSIKEKEK